MGSVFYRFSFIFSVFEIASILVSEKLEKIKFKEIGKSILSDVVANIGFDTAEKGPFKL